jgi:hypothetical protein
MTGSCGCQPPAVSLQGMSACKHGSCGSLQGMFAEVVGCTMLASSIFLTYALIVVVRGHAHLSDASRSTSLMRSRMANMHLTTTQASAWLMCWSSSAWDVRTRGQWQPRYHQVTLPQQRHAQITAQSSCWRVRRCGPSRGTSRSTSSPSWAWCWATASPAYPSACPRC